MSDFDNERSLEVDSKSFAKLGAQILARLSEAVDEVAELPVKPKPGDIDLSAFSGKIPTKTTSADLLLEQIFDAFLHGGYHLNSPGYQSYIPIGGSFEASLAELIVSFFNRLVGYREWAPALNEMEKTVVRWLTELMGLPEGSSGILTSGGSLANFTAIYTARCDRLDEKSISEGTIYVSSQAHHSVKRAGFMTGLRRAHIRTIDVDADYRIDVEKLREQIAKDIAAGLRPFLVVGIGGTTASGAVDNLEALAEIAKKYSLWFHVDAAWAGGFRMIKGGKELFRGIERADSVTFDPHKGLFLPMGCGALLVRDWHKLLEAHSTEITFLPDQQDAEEYNPAKASPELLRPIRGLQLWLPLKMHGIDPYIQYHEEKMALTHYACAELKKIPGVEILHEPQTAALVFRLGMGFKSQQNLDELNKKLIELVNDAETKISGAQFKNGFWPRLVPFGLRIHKQDIDRTLEKIKKAIQCLA